MSAGTLLTEGLGSECMLALVGRFADKRPMSWRWATLFID
jgi:hypothetical protein